MECAKPQAATKLVSQAGNNISCKARKPPQLKAFCFQNYQYNWQYCVTTKRQLRHHSLWLTQRVTLVWLLTAVSRWRIMFRPFVGLATFNCASCVLSPDVSQPTQPRRLCMLSSHVDSTTATHCCTVLPTDYSGGFSSYRTLLPAWSQVHSDGITSLRFWGTSIGCRFGVVRTISWPC